LVTILVTGFEEKKLQTGAAAKLGSTASGIRPAHLALDMKTKLAEILLNTLKVLALVAALAHAACGPVDFTKGVGGSASGVAAKGSPNGGGPGGGGPGGPGGPGGGNCEVLPYPMYRIISCGSLVNGALRPEGTQSTWTDNCPKLANGQSDPCQDDMIFIYPFVHGGPYPQHTLNEACVSHDGTVQSIQPTAIMAGRCIVTRH
jgi:hypothetical protein